MTLPIQKLCTELCRHTLHTFAQLFAHFAHICTIFCPLCSPLHNCLHTLHTFAPFFAKFAHFAHICTICTPLHNFLNTLHTFAQLFAHFAHICTIFAHFAHICTIFCTLCTHLHIFLHSLPNPRGGIHCQSVDFVSGPTFTVQCGTSISIIIMP